MEITNRRYHVLIYDDDLKMVDVYASLLAKAGYRLTIRRGVPLDATAMSVLVPDLIVLGLLDEYADAGTGFIAQLRAHPDTHLLPIVVCSGDTERLHRLETRLLAWDCTVVIRPFKGEVFLAAVRSGLERGSILAARLPDAA